METSDPAARRNGPRRYATRATGVRVVVAAVALLVAGFGLESLARSIPDAIEAAARASLPWTLGALTAELMVYMFVGLEFGRLLGPHAGLRRAAPFRLGLVTYGLGTLLPGSPAPGIVLSTAELKRRGIPVARSTLLFAWSAWFNVRVLLVLAALTATMATLRGRIPEGSLWIVLGTVGFIGSALVFSAALLARPALADHVGALLERLDWRGSGSAARSATLRLRATAFEMKGSRGNSILIASNALGSWLADAVALRLALVAVGVHAGMGAVLVAYLAATLASFTPFVPGGLGVVEVAVPAVLHRFGVNLELAIAGTLVWRSVALLLPALAGLLALVTLRMEAVPEVGATAPTPGA